MYNIHLLPAAFGDAILVEYGDAQAQHYILIDGGPYFAFKDVWTALEARGVGTLELLIVTHIDIDHIDGIVRLLNMKPQALEIKEIWFNGFAQLPKPADQLGALQGEYLSVLIKKLGIAHNMAFPDRVACIKDAQHPMTIPLKGSMLLTLLGPTLDALNDLRPVWNKEIVNLKDKTVFDERLKKDHRYKNLSPDVLGGEPKEHKDDSAANRSSIAFIGTFEGKSCLFAGDAPTAELMPAVEHLIGQRGGNEPLHLDAWKLAHHGSRRSTQRSLMEIIHCKKVLISTDGKRFEHPDAECIDQIIDVNGPGLTLYFNYSTQFNQAWAGAQMQQQRQFEAIYGQGTNGVTVRL